MNILRQNIFYLQICFWKITEYSFSVGGGNGTTYDVSNIVVYCVNDNCSPMGISQSEATNYKIIKLVNNLFHLDRESQLSEGFGVFCDEKYQLNNN